ncbi:MAG: hypothetical protein AAGF57_08445 [Pseudomonadota bacterium]
MRGILHGMSKALSITLSIVVCVVISITWFVISNWGYNTQYTEYYTRLFNVPNSEFERREGNFSIRILIDGTVNLRTDKNQGKLFSFYTTSHYGSPHTLVIASTYYGDPPGDLGIARIEITVRNEDPIVLLNNTTHPMNVPYGIADSEAAGAVYAFPIDDVLPFVDQQELTVSVWYNEPDATETKILTTRFRAEQSETKTYKIENTLLGG